MEMLSKNVNGITVFRRQDRMEKFVMSDEPLG
jgi:hypothetical protein